MHKDITGSLQIASGQGPVEMPSLREVSEQNHSALHSMEYNTAIRKNES